VHVGGGVRPTSRGRQGGGARAGSSLAHGPVRPSALLGDAHEGSRTEALPEVGTPSQRVGSRVATATATSLS
jgi:hypothetical protein